MTGHDQPMTVSEAADELEKMAALPWPASGPIGRALRVLIDHARATTPCHACEGTGTTYDLGYYVPGEQFVEPPSGPDMCGPCKGTGVEPRPAPACDPAPTEELRACFGICDHVDCLP